MLNIVKQIESQRNFEINHMITPKHLVDLRWEEYLLYGDFVSRERSLRQPQRYSTTTNKLVLTTTYDEQRRSLIDPMRLCHVYVLKNNEYDILHCHLNWRYLISNSSTKYLMTITNLTVSLSYHDKAFWKYSAKLIETFKEIEEAKLNGR